MSSLEVRWPGQPTTKSQEYKCTRTGEKEQEAKQTLKWDIEKESLHEVLICCTASHSGDKVCKFPRNTKSRALQESALDGRLKIKQKSQAQSSPQIPLCPALKPPSVWSFAWPFIESTLSDASTEMLEQDRWSRDGRDKRYNRNGDDWLCMLKAPAMWATRIKS